MTDHFGYVYRITNRVNSKTYVGQRRCSRDSTWNEYYGSGALIKASIAKYGRENFTKGLISYAESIEELNSLEADAIIQEWAQGHGEYNQRVHIPSPDSWTRLPSGSLARIQIKRREQQRKWHAENVNPRHTSAEEDYRKFLQETDLSLLTEKYRELGSVSNVALTLGLSRRRTARFLSESGVLNPSRTSKGIARSDADKQSISRAMQVRNYGSVCSKCFNEDTSTLCLKHRPSSPTIREKRMAEMQARADEVIALFKSKGSMRATARELELSARFVNEVLEMHGIEKPQQSTEAARKARMSKLKRID